MAVPVILKILVEKDSSVDAITKQVQATIAGLGNSGTGDIFGGLTASAAGAQTALHGVSSELEAVSRIDIGANDSVRSLGELKTVALGAAVNAKALGDEAATLKPKLKEAFEQGGDAAEKASKKIQSLQAAGTAVGAALAATGTALLGLAGFALKTAIEFEQLQAKLVTVTGSSLAAARAFAFAKDYAAKTPFDVQGIVAATVTLEAYKQRAETSLPRVAALAAGLGRPIHETALVLGKALSGSAEGFESLRNEYGITTADLKKYGAEVDKNSSLLIHNEAQLAKAKTALNKIVDLRFGDAIERQSKTAAGALSNAGDAVKNLADSFGQTLLPGLAIGLKVFTAVIEKISGIPPEAKGVLAVLAVLSGGFAVTAGATVLAYTGLVVLNAQLAATTVQTGLTTIALDSTNFALVTMGKVGGTAAGILKGLTGSAGGAALGIAGVALAIANLVIEYQRYKAEKLGDEIKDESKRVQAVTQDYRLLLDTLNKVAIARGQKPVVPTADPQKQFTAIGENLQNLPKAELVKAFSTAGFTTESLKKQFEDLGAKTKDVNGRLLAVASAIGLIEKAEKAEREAAGAFSEGLRDAARVERDANLAKAANTLRSVGFQGLADTLDGDKLKTALRGLNNEIKQLSASKQIVTGLKAAFVELADPLEAIVKRAAQLKDFFRLAEGINSANSLAAAYGKVNEQLKVAHEAPGIRGKSREQLAIEVADPKTPANVKDAIVAIEGLEQQKRSIQEKTLAFEEGQFKKKQFLTVESTQTQLDAVNEQLANVAAGSSKEVALKKETVRLRRVLNQDALTAEIEFLGFELKFAEGNAEKQLEIQKQIAEDRKALREKDAADAKHSLEETNRTARQSLDKVRETPDSTPKDAINAIDGVLSKLREWEASNRKIIAQNPELKKDYEELVRSNVLEQAREAAKIPVENLTKLKGVISEIQAGAIGPVRQLEAVERSIALVKQAQISHLITQKGGEAELLALAKAKETAEKAITAEKRAQAAEIRNLEGAKRDQDIAILEKRKDAGENVDAELAKAKKEKLGSAHSDIDAEKNAYIDAHGNTQEVIEHAEQVAAFKREALRKDEATKIFDAQHKQEQDYSQSMDRQDTRYQQSIDGRNNYQPQNGNASAGIPTGNTPGVDSKPGGFGKGFSLGGFSLPGFGEFTGGSQYSSQASVLDRQNRPNTFGQGHAFNSYASALEKVKQQERDAIKGGTSIGQDALRTGGDVVSRETLNATINVNGQGGTKAERNLVQAAKAVMDENITVNRNQNLRYGTNRPQPYADPATRADR